MVYYFIIRLYVLQCNASLSHRKFRSVCFEKGIFTRSGGEENYDGCSFIRRPELHRKGRCSPTLPKTLKKEEERTA